VGDKAEETAQTLNVNVTQESDAELTGGFSSSSTLYVQGMLVHLFCQGVAKIALFGINRKTNF